MSTTTDTLIIVSQGGGTYSVDIVEPDRKPLRVFFANADELSGELALAIAIGFVSPLAACRAHADGLLVLGRSPKTERAQDASVDPPAKDDTTLSAGTPPAVFNVVTAPWVGFGLTLAFWFGVAWLMGRFVG